MFQKIEVLSSIEERDQDLVFETVSGTIGIALKIHPIDVELINDDSMIQAWNAVIHSVPPEMKLRFISKTQFKQKDIEGLSRTNAIDKLGFFQDDNFILLEAPKPLLSFLGIEKKGFLNELQKLSQKFRDLTIDIGKSGDIHWKPVTTPTLAEVESLFLPVDSEISVYPDYVVINQTLIGFVRIKSNTYQVLSLESLSNVRSRFDFPHEVSTTFERLSTKRQMGLLNHLKTESKQATVSSEYNRKEEVERLDDAVSQFEENIFNVELIIKVTALHEKELRERLRLVATVLQKEFNSHYVESFGAYPTLQASIPGSPQHVTFRELGSGIIFYAPVFSTYSEIQQTVNKMTLRLHRRNKSLQSVNLIDNLYKSGNTMIIGPKGSGKSVFCGLLTQSIFNDPSVKILKVDVGSSYTRECQKLGGVRFGLELNEPSGLNPLEVFARTPHDLEIANIVSSFIEVLITKERVSGFGLDDEEKSVLDCLVIAYSESRPQAPSLDDFLSFTNGQIPNQNLLQRWTAGGMYANIFKPIPGIEHNRYRYYDFISVNNATNSSLVKGSIAAVMAQYNSEVAISGRNGSRIFLFCDETTEFLNQCSPFFVTTIQNARKFGHGIILMNQGSNAFQVRDRKGELTNSLFENTDHHFLFATPVDPKDAENFKERHALDGAEYQRVKSLSFQKGKYAEVFYKTELGGQRLKIELSQEEYWLLTSDKNDYDKLDHLKKIGFSEEDAMLCLSQLHSQLY